MEPIISPWVFYLIFVLDNLSTLAALSGVCLVIVGLTGCLMYHADMLERNRANISFCRKLIIRGVVLLLIGGIIPEKGTCYKMLAAHYVTKDNITEVQSNTLEFVNKLAKAIEDAKEKK